VKIETIGGDEVGSRRLVSCCGDGDVGFVSKGNGRRKEEKKGKWRQHLESRICNALKLERVRSELFCTWNVR